MTHGPPSPCRPFVSVSGVLLVDSIIFHMVYRTALGDTSDHYVQACVDEHDIDCYTCSLDKGYQAVTASGSVPLSSVPVSVSEASEVRSSF